jgi:hypothetical protein
MKIFKDLLTNEKFYFVLDREDDEIYKILCEKFGTGYVLENIFQIN